MNWDKERGKDVFWPNQSRFYNWSNKVFAVDDLNLFFLELVTKVHNLVRTCLDLPLSFFSKTLAKSSSWSGFMWADAFKQRCTFDKKHFISWQKISLYMKICRPPLWLWSFVFGLWCLTRKIQITGALAKTRSRPLFHSAQCLQCNNSRS